MSLARTQPVRFSPSGLSDSLDESDIFPGAMASLQNLIPDPTTKNLWTCRPASTLSTNFGSFTAPGFVSVFKVSGPLVYGMIASGRYPGFDEPFCFNLATGNFIVVSGVTGQNVPASPPTTGDWTPPTMDLVGVNMIVTHPGFNGVKNFIGWFNLTNAAAPVWHAGNLGKQGTILTFGTLSGGSAYNNGTYNNVPLIGGSGAGAIANITIAGGVVTNVALVNGGTGYVDGDSLSALVGNIGGVGSGFSVLVATVTLGAIQFTTVPTWVRQFNQRAWFGINPIVGQPSVIFTDVLALQCTNSNQALTFGDNTPLTAAIGLPLNNQLGGIIQALLVFKQLSQIVQITGDAATSNLSQNTLDVATGTLSPRSLCATPIGIAFLAPDGLRIIDFNAHVSDPIGVAGSGVNVPFLSPIAPSRVAADCNGKALRISVQNTNAANAPTQEFWYDLPRKVWSGPHTFPASMIDVYNNQFVVAPVGVTAKLFLSPAQPNFVSGSVENGAQLTFVYQTACLEDNGQMAESEATETQVKTTQVAAMTGFTIKALTPDNNVISSVTFAFNLPASQWGSMIWGQGDWGGPTKALFPRKIDWPIPLVYNRVAFQITGNCAQGFQIGDIFFRRRILGYVQAEF